MKTLRVSGPAELLADGKNNQWQTEMIHE